MDGKEKKRIVREAYGDIARGQGCCGTSTCGPDVNQVGKFIGYSDEELRTIPEEANLGLGCGNPTGVANLREGDVVLDLGSGAGFDCFLAASKVGTHGKVIGVDMTPEMVEKAKNNAKRSGVVNVDFRLGEIEDLPVEDNSVDVVISNCVINLSVDKPKVFKEIYRVLKPGGKVAISDIALLRELPENVKNDVEAYVGCVGGAVTLDEYRKVVLESGLKEIKITEVASSACIDPSTNDPIGRAVIDGLGGIESLQGYVVSVNVEGCKI